MTETCRRSLKQHPWVLSLWIPLRARQQERRIHREARYYTQEAENLRIGRELDDMTLRQALQCRLGPRRLAPNRIGDLHIVYATPLGIWEKHNVPPALQRFGTLTPFYLTEQGFDDKRDDWIDTRHHLDDALLRFVAQAHARRPVSVLVSYLSGWHVSPGTIRAINQMGIPTCAFWWDDRLSFRGPMKGGRYTGAASLAPAYDLNLTNASESVVKYLVEGGLAMFWPEGANPEHFRPLDGPFAYDVSFVGACYGQRPAYVDFLRRRGIRIEAFGPGWPNGPLSENDMVEAYARSRINLGFSGIGYSSREMCLKGRDFEVPMSGAVYLTSEQPDLHRVYEVGREVVTYRSKVHCLAQIRHLLAAPDECARIRQAARQRSLREHTWERRFGELFRLIGVLDC